uniref:Ig-like domain-containing protein n=1 Tax=Draconibacterium sp. TaxID=1965318 RepID=UPI003567D145
MRRSLLIVLVNLLFCSVGFSQTPGLIIKPAETPGQTVLDPDGDGYVSKKTNGVQIGFTNPPGDDVTQSEIPYVAIVRPDPSDDILRGPTDGFIEIVGTDAAGNNAILTYNDGTNILYRFRMGGYAPNSKSYSLLIDTDQKFGFTGINADPNALPGNPGFEMEIVLKTNFSVDVYFVDGLTNGIQATSNSFDTNCQQSIAVSNAGGDADYFYDFFIPITDFNDPDLSTLGIDENTPIRIVALTTMNPHEATGNNALSDIGGVTTGSNIDQIFIDLIEEQTPTPPGGEILDRSDCPSIDPVRSTDALITGSSTEASGTSVEVFLYHSDGSTLLGSATTTTSGTSWAIDISSLSPAVTLTDGQIVKAAATAEGKGESYDNCDETIVASQCSNPITGGVINSNANKGVAITVDPGYAEGSIITLYYSDGTIFPNANLATTGGSAGDSNPATITSGDYDIEFKCKTGNCFGSDVYLITIQQPGECESDYFYYCGYASGVSAAPTITTSEVTETTTSIVGVGTEGSSLINLYADGVQIGTTTSDASTPYNWSISVSNLKEGSVITAKQIVSGQCLSDVSNTVYVKRDGISPIINTEGCSLSTPVTSVSGVSVEELGSQVNLYDVTSGRSLLNTTTVQAGGVWTISGLNLTAGDRIAATVSSAAIIESEDSDTITISTKTSLSGVTITIDQPTEGETVVSGTINDASYPTTLKVYVDETLVGSGVTISANGSWSANGLTSFDLAVGSTVQVTLENESSCESDFSSTSAIVSCLSPLDKTISASTSIYCAEEYGIITVESSESGVIYTPILASDSSTFGFSFMGNGADIDLYTDQLSENPTLLRVLASKFPYGSCKIILSDTVALTVNPLPAIPSGSTNQTYCSAGSTTLGDLNVIAPSGSTIKWYDASSNGNLLAASTVLSDGSTYYAESENSTTGCTSSSRLAVTVAEGNPEVPTGDANQSLCDGATILDLEATVSGPGTIIWYDAPSGGNIYNSTDEIVNNKKYYAEASQFSCYSTSRLEVTASISSSVGGNASPANVTICSGNTTTITLSGYTGSIQWQQSADGLTGWTDVSAGSGATSALYSTGNLTTNTYYRAEVTNGSCASAYSDTVLVSVAAASVGGDATITDASVCSGSSTTISLNGYTGIIQWQQSANGSTGWSNVSSGSGATSALYSTGNLNTNTYYRAEVTNGSCATAYSDTVKVIVNEVVGGTASGNQTVSSGDDPAALTVSGAFGTGTVSYQWQQSIISGVTGYTNIGGATSSGYDPPVGISVTTYLRRVITSSLNGVNCSDTSTYVTITVNAVSNTAPLAVKDEVTISEDTTIAYIDVQANDTDAEGDDLSTTIISGPNSGTAEVVNGDSISYIPQANWFGTDTLVYQVCDNGSPSQCDQDTVIITVTPENDAP